MPRKQTLRKPKKQNQQYLTLNAAIGIVGVLLLGFIYSFSQKIKETVREKFDILLEEEVSII